MNTANLTYRPATTANTFFQKRAPNKLSILSMAGAPAITCPIDDIPKSFMDSLTQIDAFKGKFREAKYLLIASVYLACQLGYKNKKKAEIDKNDEVLSERCKDLNIDGRTYYQKLGKIAFGDDSKRVSSIVHVIKVAEMHSIDAADFVEWLKREGGIQKIRTTYNADGSEKKDCAQAKAIGAKKIDTQPDEYYIEKGKADLSSSAATTIPAGKLPVIDLIGNEAECTAILRQRADGSFDVKVVLNDKDLVEQLYCAHGRTLPGERT